VEGRGARTADVVAGLDQRAAGRILDDRDVVAIPVAGQLGDRPGGQAQRRHQVVAGTGQLVAGREDLQFA
jgi:hypothetical protein